MIYDLPTSLTVCGTEYDIRSDFREILDVITVLNDGELTDQERAIVALHIFYPDFENMPIEHCREALRQCFWFINGGVEEAGEQKQRPKLMDWEQDFRFIISPVNRVVGHEIRADKHFHWWSFLAAYQEIGECTFAQIVHIRDSLCRGKSLNKEDQEWYRKNRDLVDMKTKYTQAEEDVLSLWGGGG